MLPEGLENLYEADAEMGIAGADLFHEVRFTSSIGAGFAASFFENPRALAATPARRAASAASNRCDK